MKNYRTPDQDYYDRYDGHTIKWLKEIEEEERKLYPKTIIVDKKPHTITYNPFIKRNTIGVNRSRHREETVKQWMREDEEKDALIKNTRIPEAPRCGTCNTRMYPNGHMFDAFDHKFLFVFDCPTEQHKSRKIVQPN